MGILVLLQVGGVQAQENLPEKQEYEVRRNHSLVAFSIFPGDYESPVDGIIRMYLGDPDVPFPEIPGEIGLSILKAELDAPELPPFLGSPYTLDPEFPSIGSYNTISKQIVFQLNLISATGTDPPVPFSLLMGGTLNAEYMWVTGENDAYPDAGVRLTLGVIRRDVLFSTETGFHPGTGSYAGFAISDGDLLSEAGQLVATNRFLTRNLGMKPIAADIGLDAIYQHGIGERFFSSEVDDFSEILGPLGNGDLFAESGYIARYNAELIGAFMPMPPLPEVGLDAVHILPNGLVLFSVEDSFFSESLGITISDGDLLSESGVVVMNNYQLMSRFAPVGPITDYGLDAVYFTRPRVNTVTDREVLFSTEEGFYDYNLGPISDGDLLSSEGYVVRRNLELVAAFAPVEDLDNFGLDAVHVRRVLAGDMNSDNDVDLSDFVTFATCFSGSGNTTPPSACEPVDFLASDLDGNGSVDLRDFMTFAANYTG